MSSQIVMTKRHGPSRLLRQLLEFVNSVPPEMELPEPSRLGRKLIPFMKNEAFAAFRKLVGGVEPDTSLRKLLGAKSPKIYNRALGNYVLLRSGREWLRAVALIGKLQNKYRFRRWTMPTIQLPNVSAQTNQRGELQFNLGPLVAALEGIEPFRIRTCPICSLIYWAARKDKPCCSPKCAHVLRTRRWRQRYQDRYRDERKGKRRGRRESKEALEREDLRDLRAVKSGRRTPRLPKLPK